ncbi:MAG: hypothetical protein ABJA49_14725 [Betaproteobacteria bacterium]
MSDARHDAARNAEADQTAAAAVQKKATERARTPAKDADASTISRPASNPDWQSSAIGTPQVRGAAQPGMGLGRATATAGSTGAIHITFEKFWQPVDNHLPCGFDVATLPGHGLVVTLEQLAYCKKYDGTGTVKTGLTPVAPIGTTGRMIARDLVTGETLEVPWTWHMIGGGGGTFWAGLVRAVKRALWNG